MTLSVFLKLYTVAVVDLVWGAVLCATVSGVTLLASSRLIQL